MQAKKIACTTVFEKNYRNPAPTVVNVGSVRSSKSYSIRQCLISYALQHPGLHIGICRKIASTLQHSVIKQFLSALADFGVYDRDNFNKSERFYQFDLKDRNPKQSDILFFGLDDVDKIKSTEFNIIWLEEATDFTYDDYSFLLTRLSAPKPEGWEQNQTILSLNPGDARGWIKTKLLPQKGVALINSTYKDNPFLSAEYVKSLLAMKETNPRLYKMLVLGEWGQTEGRIFEKWQLYDNSTAPKHFDGEFLGLDFGYNHATALIRAQFRENEVYLSEILYKRHITNTELIELMDGAEVSKETEIIADCAEPDRIDDIFLAGYNVHPSDKRAGVVGMINTVKKYKIFIHKDSKNLQEEFDGYEWKKNLQGEYLDKLEPNKQHDDAIAAVRYAVYEYDKQANRTFLTV
ncbi:PBSX family phage terminase large subunit [Candidatus Avelusimicrobium faecicola]|jgi:phage terminase large subunit|uniref:PBSX family phage terminase large subunit n=1 Tax=Candidatus Avelusimicrobium faecicola TaxID=3416205 RepID=UPI0015A4B37B